jgi:hypothetical protein
MFRDALGTAAQVELKQVVVLDGIEDLQIPVVTPVPSRLFIGFAYP